MDESRRSFLVGAGTAAAFGVGFALGRAGRRARAPSPAAAETRRTATAGEPAAKTIVSRTPPEDPAKGQQWLLPEPYVDATWRGEYFGLPNGPNPTLFHARHFADARHRLLHGRDGEAVVVRASADFEEWETLTVDAQQGDRAFADGFVADGEFYLVGNDAEKGINLRAGPSLTDTTEVGRTALATNDPGVFYDGGTETIHFYTEATAASTPRISHFTAPLADPLDVTYRGDVVDMLAFTGNDTGDPEFVAVGDQYLMFVDNKLDHPTYHVSVYRSSDLSRWTPVERVLVPRYGGDFTGLHVGRSERGGAAIAGFVEFAGDDHAGIGRVDVEFFPAGAYRRTGGSWVALGGPG